LTDPDQVTLAAVHLTLRMLRSICSAK